VVGRCGFFCGGAGGSEAGSLTQLDSLVMPGLQLSTTNIHVLNVPRLLSRRTIRGRF
jgi:hypothetical protein